MDLPALIRAVEPFLHDVLHSPWLLPVLVLLIAVDGPLPVLPSETVLMSAAAAAFSTHSAPAVAGLFLAALIGSMVGDLAVFGLGRSSTRVLPRVAQTESSLTTWVRVNLFRRPVVVLVGARFVPGGRLVSGAAAGRLGLPLRSMLAGSLVSSALWAVYMLGIGLAVGPITGGNPLLCVVAGGVMAVVTGGGYAVGSRIRTAVRARRAVATTGTRDRAGTAAAVPTSRWLRHP